MRHILMSLLLFAIAAPASAQFTERERFVLRVFSVTDTTYEVVLDDFAGPSQVWCAAATFAEKVLGQRGGRIWVEKPLARSTNVPRLQSLVFSTTPVSPEKTTYSFSLRTAGVTKSLAAANGACDFFGSVVFIRANGGKLIRSF